MVFIYELKHAIDLLSEKHIVNSREGSSEAQHKRFRQGRVRVTDSSKAGTDIRVGIEPFYYLVSIQNSFPRW